MVLFLFEHFFANSLAFYFFDEGSGFIKTVNFFHSIPHLRVIEIALIGVPFFFHAVLGIKYIFSSENNAARSDGTKPSLPFLRNRAYVWQRSSACILIVLLIFHVIQMRFIRHPLETSVNSRTVFLIKVKNDESSRRIIKKMDALVAMDKDKVFIKGLPDLPNKLKLKKDQVIVMTGQSGQALLLSVLDILKDPLMAGIYLVFVLMASFHAANGLWTSLITWGFIISNRAQSISLKVCFWIFIFVLALGLVSILNAFLY